MHWLKPWLHCTFQCAGTFQCILVLVKNRAAAEAGEAGEAGDAGTNS